MSDQTVKKVLDYLKANGGGTSKVVEEWHAEDGSSWYRKWSSGLIEQSGTTAKLRNDNAVAVTFPIRFTSVIVHLTAQRRTGTNGWTPSFNALSLTGTTISNSGQDAAQQQINWYVAGY